MRAEQPPHNLQEKIMAHPVIPATPSITLKDELTQAYVDQAVDLTKVTEQSSRLYITGVQQGLVIAFAHLTDTDLVEAQAFLDDEARYHTNGSI
jgi:hypothetical protein